MAVLYPSAMAARLRSLLCAVSDAAVAGMESTGHEGGKVALLQTQAAVQSMVPALRSYGAQVGVGAHFVVQVIHAVRRLYYEIHFLLYSFLDIGT